MKKSWRSAGSLPLGRSRGAAAASGLEGIAGIGLGGVALGTARGATTARGGTGPGTGRAGTGGELSVLKGALGA